jgi:wyosine [tRNA(Phe)-imidazoG37] synthetase (radical SAM superfamily)
MRLPLTSEGSPEPRYLSARHSRRAGGPVLEVDLSPEGGCNWTCVYCDTVRARAEGPDIDQERLAAELNAALDRAAEPDFAPGAPLAGILVSGRGEPTHVFDLPPSMRTVAEVLGARGLVGGLPVRLASNGERMSEKRSRAALATLAELGGSVWYKLDTATREGLRELNGTDLILRQMRNNLKVAAEAVPTTLATCVFERGGAPSLDEAGREAYVALVRSQLAARVPIQGVHLYSPYRPHGTAAEPDPGWVEAFATELREHLPVEVHLGPPRA